MLMDLESSKESQIIEDLDMCEHQTIVQKVVDAGLMSLDENGRFNPDDAITGQMVVAKLERILEEGQ